MSVFAAIYSNWAEELPNLLEGLLISLKLTGISLAVGFPFGLLLAVMIMSRRRLTRALALVVVELGRGAPLLVLLELMYFGLPQVHITLGQFVAAVIAFAWSTGAYSTEILRASLEAVPKGQGEAAAATGLGRGDAFRFVILPQAIRIAVPPLMNVAINIFQGTSLVFVIAIPEIMSRAYQRGSETFEYLSIFILAAALYAAVSLPAARLVGVVEQRLGRHLAK